MKRIFVVFAILAALVFAANEVRGDCTFNSSVTSQTGCNEGGAGGQGGAGGAGGQGGSATATGGSATATGGSSSATVGDTKATVGDVKATVGDTKATVGDVRTGNIKITNPTPAITPPGTTGSLPSSTQPQMPKGWVNIFGFKPSRMTYEEAEDCAGRKADWDGRRKVGFSREIQLFWAEEEAKSPPLTRIEAQIAMNRYVGTAKAADYERSSSMAVLCSAALKAMQNGAEIGLITYAYRPEGHTSSRGVGGTFGFSGIVQGGANPYAIAGGGGPMLGDSTSRTRGELLVHIQSFCIKCDTAKKGSVPDDNYHFPSDLYSSN